MTSEALHTLLGGPPRDPARTSGRSGACCRRPTNVFFLHEQLAPGAPVVVVRDRSLWPVTRLSDRHGLADAPGVTVRRCGEDGATG